MIMCAQASTVAAPPMSFFMISMALFGLEIEPAGVEAHALADQGHFWDRSLCPSGNSISRGARLASAARPTA